MTIPTPAPADMKTAHGFIATKNILGDGGQQTAVMRQAGGKRRAVVKDKFALGRIFGQSFLKNIIFLPKFQYFLFVH